MDLRGAAQANRQHQGLVEAPQEHQQLPQRHPIPASTIYRQPSITYGPQPHPDTHAPASHQHLGTATSQGPQRLHGAHTQHPHDPQGRPDPQPAQNPPLPPPPTAVPPPHLPPPPPPKTRPHTQHAAAPTSRWMSMPPPTHTTASTPSRGRQKKPHPQTPHATTSTTPPQPTPTPHHSPHHHPPHRPNPTPCTTPQRYGSTFGDSGTRRCCPSTPRAPPRASGRPRWSRRPLWGKASENSSSTPSSTSPDTTAPHSPPQTARARPPRGTESGCPPLTGGDT